MSWTATVDRYLDHADLPAGERLPSHLIDRAPEHAIDWVDQQLERADLSDERLRRLHLLSAELWAREGVWEPLFACLAADWLEGAASPLGWLHALADAGHWQSVRTHLRLWERTPTEGERAALDALVEQATSQGAAALTAIEAFAERPAATTWRALLPFVPAAHQGPPGTFVIGKLLLHGVPPRRILRGLLDAGEDALAEDLVLSGVLDDEAAWGPTTAEA